MAMMTPPTAGPTIEAVCRLSWLSAIAAGSRSAGTRRGIADDRAGWSIEARLAARKATPKIAGNDGGEPSARTASARLQNAIPTEVTRMSRRRSTASATAPAPSDNARMGTSWTAARKPTVTVDWVSTYTWNGSAIRVIWLPIELTT